MKRQVVIATISLARNKKERESILKALAKLNKLGLPIFLTDESQSKFPIFNKAKKLKNIHAFKATGLDSKIKRSLSEASRIGQFIFYTESDKFEFIHDHAGQFLEKLRNNIPKVVILAARSPSNFKNLPNYQRTMEYFISDSFKALTGLRHNDFSYGPRIFPSSLVKYLLRVKSPLQWGWQTYLLIISYRLRLPIQTIQLNTTSPIDIQQNKELIIFRMQQLVESLRGIQLGWRTKL